MKVHSQLEEVDLSLLLVDIYLQGTLFLRSLTNIPNFNKTSYRPIVCLQYIDFKERMLYKNFKKRKV
mgnify:CR=1 FL=1